MAFRYISVGKVSIPACVDCFTEPSDSLKECLSSFSLVKLSVARLVPHPQSITG